VANARQIASAFAMRPDDVVVNWLPLLHDMGLVGHVVHIIQQGVTCVHMTPQSMIRKPLRWLQTISRYRATVSGGPDFAWRLLADRLAPGDLEGLDLSQWRVAFSGAEPVRAGTLERVADLLRPAGFSARSFLPCYGMAEATLIVSGGPNGQPPRTNAPTVAGDAIPGAVVSCGRIVIECDVAIVDPETGARLPDRRMGEVWVTGPHIADGYWGRPELTAATFHNRLADDGRRWLRTGDRGFMADGELHINGRIKDLLIVNGRKHHPEDLEATIQATVAACASGSAAVFQTDGDSPMVVVTVEVEDRPASQQQHADLTQAVSAAVWSRHEVLVDKVLVVRVGRIPRTTSGKVRRAETRTLWIAGALATENPHG
jgi:acyl-CoA synthetase (AMP-forming)/AMP-acid ligase II